MRGVSEVDGAGVGGREALVRRCGGQRLDHDRRDFFEAWDEEEEEEALLLLLLLELVEDEVEEGVSAGVVEVRFLRLRTPACLQRRRQF